MNSSTAIRNTTRTALTATAIAAALSLAACSKTDQAEVKAQASDTAAKVEEKAREVGQDAAAGMAKAKDAAANATATMGEKVDDAVITTSVKAELAKDSDLSALKINVDTMNGRVALKGTAPTTAASQRATTLATSVKGVLGVDNQLTVK
jgi:hyperosmotically inducible periplasmic protein